MSIDKQHIDLPHFITLYHSDFKRALTHKLIHNFLYSSIKILYRAWHRKIKFKKSILLHTSHNVRTALLKLNVFCLNYFIKKYVPTILSCSTYHLVLDISIINLKNKRMNEFKSPTFWKGNNNNNKKYMHTLKIQKKNKIMCCVKWRKDIQNKKKYP